VWDEIVIVAKPDYNNSLARCGESAALFIRKDPPFGVEHGGDHT